MQVPENCSDLKDLLGAYAIGATTASENQAIEQLLPRCPEAQAELNDYLIVRDALTHVQFGAKGKGPSQDLLDEIEYEPTQGVMNGSAVHAPQKPDPISKLRHVESTSDNTSVIDTKPGVPAGAWYAMGSIAAALVLVVGMIIVVNQLLVELRSDREELIQVIMDTTEEDVTAVTSETSLLQVRHRTTGYHLSLSPTESATSGGWAQVFWDEESGVGLLIIDQMPTLPSEQQYHMWLIQNGSEISVGSIRADEAGTGFLLFETSEPLTSYDMIGINIEDTQDVSQPTSPHLMTGSI